ncbi:MAG: hypothetical protein LCH54_07550 [Bacteroidetes bacterium]|nr:hypothetical protein [Bacteroidota bacterium]
MNKPRLFLFLFIAGLSLWSFPGQFNSTDGTDRYRVAHAILTGGLPEIGTYGDGIHNSTFIDDQGEFRSYFGIGQSLILIPLDIPGTALTSLVHFDQKMDFKIRLGLASLLHLFLVNFLVFLGSFLLAKTVGLNELNAVSSGLTAVFGSILWNLARAGHEESWLAVLMLLALNFGFKFQKEGKSKYLFLFVISLSAGLFFRPSFLTAIFIGVFWSLLIVYTNHRPKLKNWFFYWAGMGILTLLAIGFWNLHRTGNPIDFGYGQTGGTFSGNPFNGLVQPIFGFDKGLIWTTLWIVPALIMTGFSFTKLNSDIKTLGSLVILFLLLNLMFHSFWFSWAGDHTWGARFQGHLIPLLAIIFWGCIQLKTEIIKWQTRMLLLSGIIASQIPSLCFWDTLEYLQAEKSGRSLISTNGSPTGTDGQILMRYSNIIAKLSTGSLANFGEPETIRLSYSLGATSWNFWPWMIQKSLTTPLHFLFISLWNGLLVSVFFLFSLILNSPFTHERFKKNA